MPAASAWSEVALKGSRRILGIQPAPCLYDHPSTAASLHDAHRARITCPPSAHRPAPGQHAVGVRHRRGCRGVGVWPCMPGQFLCLDPLSPGVVEAGCAPDGGRFGPSQAVVVIRNSLQVLPRPIMLLLPFARDAVAPDHCQRALPLAIVRQPGSLVTPFAGGSCSTSIRRSSMGLLFPRRG